MRIFNAEAQRRRVRREVFDRIYRIYRIWAGGNSSSQEVAHEMALEAVLRPDLLFRKRYPVVHTVSRRNAVLPVEQ